MRGDAAEVKVMMVAGRGFGDEAGWLEERGGDGADEEIVMLSSSFVGCRRRGCSKWKEDLSIGLAGW